MFHSRGEVLAKHGAMGCRDQISRRRFTGMMHGLPRSSFGREQVGQFIENRKNNRALFFSVPGFGAKPWNRDSGFPAPGKIRAVTGERVGTALFSRIIG